MSNPKSKKQSRRISSSGSGDCGCTASHTMPGEVGELETLHLMPGSEDFSSNLSAGGMHANDDDQDGRMPGGGMDARDEDADDGMPGGGMGGGGFGGGGFGSGGSGSGGGGRDGDTPQSRSCATMEVHHRLLRDPAYARARDEIENQARFFEVAAERPGVTRIPVVVHVVWNTAAQNISDAQIASQIDVLNRDFRRTNPDVSTTPAVFLPLAADARVEFVLASVDPGGAPTTGITRRQTTVASFSSDDAVKSQASGGTNAWPADRYLNLWVCPLAGGLLGYAQFPGGPAATDGVVIRHSAFGTVGTAAPPFHLGRTATHEIGHWLNLNHIWGDDGTGCSGTDSVADTPNQAGANTVRRHSRTSPAAMDLTAICS